MQNNTVRSKTMAMIVAVGLLLTLTITNENSVSTADKAIQSLPVYQENTQLLANSGSTNFPHEATTISIPPVVAKAVIHTIAKPKKKVLKPIKSVKHSGSVVSGSQWDILASCEAGGNWHARNPSGKYTGGIQADRATWLTNGGGKYAPIAGEASKEQQIEIGEVIKSQRGWSPWPQCSRKLGLR